MAKKIIAVLGDFYHRRDWAQQALEAAVQSLAEKVEIYYKTREELVESLSERPDAVILFSENRFNPEDENVVKWMDDKAAQAITDYVRSGGGWLAWHSGLASYENVEEYTAMLHGYFKYHPAEHQIVRYTNGNDVDFGILDEHYFVECDEEKTNVFLRSDSVDGSSIAGWKHDFGKGRVICYVPAHLEEGLMDPEVQKSLTELIEEVSK